MANPNIVNVTSIYGKTVTQNATTVSTNVVVNAASSNSIFKINSIYISNITSSNTANITTSLFRGGIEYNFTNGVSVPPSTTVVVLSKDTSIYLEEGDAIRIRSSANSSLQTLVSYEEIS